MELRHLEYFVKLAQTLHYGQAAAHLGIAVPTLSVQIKQLEDELDTVLFLRTNRSVRLSEPGVIFLAEAIKTLEQAQRTLKIGRQSGRGERGIIRLSYVSSALWSGVLAEMINSFRTLYPDVQFITQQASMAALPGMVDNRQTDVAIIRGDLPLPEGLMQKVLIQDSFCLALNIHDPLTASQQIAPSQLAECRLIIPEQESVAWEVARRGGFRLTDYEQPGGLLEVLTRVTLQEGVALVPAALKTCVSLPDVCYRELTPPALTSEIKLIYGKWNQNQALARFIASVNQRY